MPAEQAGAADNAEGRTVPREVQAHPGEPSGRPRGLQRCGPRPRRGCPASHPPPSRARRRGSGPTGWTPTLGRHRRGSRPVAEGPTDQGGPDRSTADGPAFHPPVRQTGNPPPARSGQAMRSPPPGPRTSLTRSARRIPSRRNRDLNSSERVERQLLVLGGLQDLLDDVELRAALLARAMAVQHHDPILFVRARQLGQQGTVGHVVDVVDLHRADGLPAVPLEIRHVLFGSIVAAPDARDARQPHCAPNDPPK